VVEGVRRLTAVEIATIIGVFLSGVGTAVAVYDARSRRRARRPQLTVEAHDCLLPWMLEERFYCFKVSNPGERALTLNNIQLGVVGGQSIVYPNMEGQPPLPCRLEPGESGTYYRRGHRPGLRRRRQRLRSTRKDKLELRIWRLLSGLQLPQAPQRGRSRQCAS
jgi:hypothetical protein